MTNTLFRGTFKNEGYSDYYQVVLTKKTLKSLKKLPQDIIQRFTVLAEQLRELGPLAHNWKNFSKLSKDTYHCHLTYSYVACWQHRKNTIVIEVYYVGSRENAPY